MKSFIEIINTKFVYIYVRRQSVSMVTQEPLVGYWGRLQLSIFIIFVHQRIPSPQSTREQHKMKIVLSPNTLQIDVKGSASVPAGDAAHLDPLCKLSTGPGTNDRSGDIW